MLSLRAGSGGVANGRDRAGRVGEVQAEDDARGDGGSDYDQEISAETTPGGSSKYSWHQLTFKK